MDIFTGASSVVSVVFFESIGSLVSVNELLLLDDLSFCIDDGFIVFSIVLSFTGVGIRDSSNPFFSISGDEFPDIVDAVAPMLWTACRTENGSFGSNSIATDTVGINFGISSATC